MPRSSQRNDVMNFPTFLGIPGSIGHVHELVALYKLHEQDDSSAFYGLNGDAMLSNIESLEGFPEFFSARYSCRQGHPTETVVSRIAVRVHGQHRGDGEDVAHQTRTCSQYRDSFHDDTRHSG